MVISGVIGCRSGYALLCFSALVTHNLTTCQRHSMHSRTSREHANRWTWRPRRRSRFTDHSFTYNSVNRRLHPRQIHNGSRDSLTVRRHPDPDYKQQPLDGEKYILRWAALVCDARALSALSSWCSRAWPETAFTNHPKLVRLLFQATERTAPNSKRGSPTPRIFGAAALVRAGDARCVLALGFEFMTPVALGTKPHVPRPPSPRPAISSQPRSAPCQTRSVGRRGRVSLELLATEYFRVYEGGVKHLAEIGEFCAACCVCLFVIHTHRRTIDTHINNPYAQCRAGYDEATALGSLQISNDLTNYMCTQPSFRIVLIGVRWLSTALSYFSGWSCAVSSQTRHLYMQTSLRTRSSSSSRRDS